MADRLRRLDRVFSRARIYFVTANAHERQSILPNREVHERLIAFAKAGPAHGAWLGAYVRMPDHLHALVALNCSDGEVRSIELSAWVKSCKNSLSKALRLCAVPAPHWQKGAFDHLLPG